MKTQSNKDLSYTVATLSMEEGAKAYRELREQVEHARILDRSYGYYVFMTLFTFAGFFISIFGIFVSHSIWAIIIASAGAGFFGVQLDGILHDAGHRAIFKSVFWNDVIGHVAAGFTAMSHHSWRIRHNKHHAHTNEMGEDPDMDIPLHALTKEQFFQETGMAKLFLRYQAYLYYPLRMFVFLSERWSGLEYLVKEYKPAMIWQLLMFGVGFFAWFILPFLIFDLQKALLVSIFVNLTSGLYASNIFAPNHKSMPQLKKGQQMSFLEQQIITSRNVKASLIGDYLMMGLNYQIEHHLFPNCPRNKLGKLSPLIKAVCQKYNLEYTESGFIETNKIILSQLNAIAKTA